MAHFLAGCMLVSPGYYHYNPNNPNNLHDPKKPTSSNNTDNPDTNNNASNTTVMAGWLMCIVGGSKTGGTWVP
jgi:hypothetical protein